MVVDRKVFKDTKFVALANAYSSLSQKHSAPWKDWLNRPAQNGSMSGAWFRHQDIGSHSNWNQEMFTGVRWLVNSWFKMKTERISALKLDWRRKWLSQQLEVQMGMAIHSSCIQWDVQTEYSKLQDRAKNLVGLAWLILLHAANTESSKFQGNHIEHK